MKSTPQAKREQPGILLIRKFANRDLHDQQAIAHRAMHLHVEIRAIATKPDVAAGGLSQMEEQER